MLSAEANYETVVKVQDSEVAEGLAGSGVLRRCKQCGQLFDSSHPYGKYCSPACYEKYSAEGDRRRKRRYKESRRFNPGQLKWAAETKERTAARFMDNMVKLMTILGGEDGSGGVREWFMAGDIAGQGLEDSWLFDNNYANWRIMMRRLVELGNLEVKKAEEGKGSGKGDRNYNYYRFVKGL